jgi:hypothetical protein
MEFEPAADGRENFSPGVSPWGRTRRATAFTHLSRKRKKVSPFNDLGIQVDDVFTMHFSIHFKGLFGP